VVEGATRVRRHEIVGHKVLFLCRRTDVIEEFLEPHRRFDKRLVHEGKDVVVTVLRAILICPET